MKYRRQKILCFWSHNDHDIKLNIEIICILFSRLRAMITCAIRSISFKKIWFNKKIKNIEVKKQLIIWKNWKYSDWIKKLENMNLFYFLASSPSKKLRFLRDRKFFYKRIILVICLVFLAQNFIIPIRKFFQDYVFLNKTKIFFSWFNKQIIWKF